MPEIPFGLNCIPRTIEVRENRGKSESAVLTVFLGIYNATPFMGDLLLSIRNQVWSQDINLLIVDNNSTDDSLRILLENLPDMDGNISIVRNLTNIGALGSLYRNADLVETPWLTFLHQDDVYLPNFLDSSLREARLASDTPVSTISFDYRTVEGDFAPLHSPNPTWFAKGTPGYVAFKESLANHSIPWPCTVFKSEYLLQSPVPFHSAAFLDTEIALNQADLGDSRYVPEVVMNYRIHGESGSHSLPMAEAEVMRCSSMLRVFNSPDFRKLVLTVPPDKHREWASSLVQSAANYVSSDRLRDLMVISLLESIVLALEYKHAELNEFLALELSRIGAKGASFIISGLLNGESNTFQVSGLSPHSARNGESIGGNEAGSWVRKVITRLPKPLVVLIFRLAPKKFLPHPWSSYK